MYFLKYLLSKSHRYKINAEYTKELCEKFASEQKQKQAICDSIFAYNINI